MPTDEPIDELMLRWEAVRHEGQYVSPEDLCAHVPHLTDELRCRIRIVLDMERLLGVTMLDPERTLVRATPTTAPEQGLLPVIPGYEIVRMIGHGGMGVVYEARQIDLGRTVAIKMMSGTLLRPASLARFRVEAEAAAQLQHPNFVQIFEIGQVNGRPFFTMEYVAGGSLADLLFRQPVTARQATELVETLARAVHAAHVRGIVHRDLKPGNILLSDEWRVTCDENRPTADSPLATRHSSLIPKIADFGLAKRLDDDSQHTQTGEILGTPSYMAPEQAAGKKDQIGPHTDVYALGTILYELLAGKPPFHGASPLDSLRLVLEEDPVEPTRFVASLPRELEAICMKCLEKAPRHRYPSAQALADDLRCFLNGQPVTARRIGPSARAWKWIRRHPQQAALAGALAVLMLIPVVVMLENYRSHRQVLLTAQAHAPMVREILERNCFACHGRDPKDTQKNLDILNHQQLLDSARRIVVAGSPENSRLIQRIADGSMPPEEEEARLPRVTERELTILSDWIRGGAPALPPPDPEHPVISAAPHSALAAQAKAIFHQHCYECHKYDVAKGGIKILHHRLLTTVRKVVVPGHPDESELYLLLKSDDDELRMPPSSRQRLSTGEIAVIRAWIEDGAAPFPRSE